MWAEQTTTVDDELLGSSTGEPGQRFRFARPPVLPGELVEVREPGSPVEPETWTAWTEVVDFYGSGPFDRHYVLDRATGDLAFGDGRAGAIPAQGSANVRATLYRTGGGERGNRPAGAVSQLKTTVPYVDAVVNHEPATGGTDLETPDAVKERGPRTLRHGGRAVALEDFEDLAVQASPDLARVRGIPAPAAGGLGRVALIVVPRSGERRPAPSLELLAHVQDYLAARVSPTFDLLVVGPGWLKVTVEAEIAVVSLEAATDVEGAVLAGVTRFLDPIRGGFDGSGWPFGRRPHRSDVEALIEAVPGVDYVRSLAVREEQASDERPPVPDAFLVYSGDHAVTVVGAE
jgi:predicted phage baseplate assembly protein